MALKLIIWSRWIDNVNNPVLQYYFPIQVWLNSTGQSTDWVFLLWMNNFLLFTKAVFDEVRWNFIRQSERAHAEFIFMLVYAFAVRCCRKSKWYIIMDISIFHFGNFFCKLLSSLYTYLHYISVFILQRVIFRRKIRENKEGKNRGYATLLHLFTCSANCIFLTILV